MARRQRARRERPRRKPLIEPATSAVGDIVFNLIIFFLVCASTDPDSGKRQELPRSESQQQQQPSKNIEVALGKETASVNGVPTRLADFRARIQQALANQHRPEDRIVVVKSSPQTQYEFWIQITQLIDQAGGVVTLQLEEDQQVLVR